MTFGEKLKELRINKAEMGLRNFSEIIGISASELSEIERGLAPPPSDEKWVFMVIQALGLFMEDEGDELHTLWEEPFLMKKVPEDIIIPFPPHDRDGNPLSAEKITELQKYLIDEAKAHNVKADEYNRNNTKNSKSPE